MTNLRIQLRQDIQNKQKELDSLQNKCLQGELLYGNNKNYEVLKDFDIVDLIYRIIKDSEIENVDEANMLTELDKVESYLIANGFIAEKIIVEGNIRKFATISKKILSEEKEKSQQVNAQVLGG